MVGYDWEEEESMTPEIRLWLAFDTCEQFIPEDCLDKERSMSSACLQKLLSNLYNLIETPSLIDIVQTTITIKRLKVSAEGENNKEVCFSDVLNTS